MRRGPIITVLVAAALVAVVAWRGLGTGAPDAPAAPARERMVGEAGRGEVTVALRDAQAPVAIIEARVPGRPIVLIDPGHGGRDPGTVVPGGLKEKDLTLATAQELRERLAEAGRVRVALTRPGDATLSLEQRAAVARAIGAALYVSIHMDSAPNPQATGVTVYSLADVASTEEAARLVRAERERVGQVVTLEDNAVEGLLTDLALRDQMAASAAFARRFLRRAEGRVPLRPTPHQFADFVVLRRAQSPGVLVEAGYISNDADAARLGSKEGRAPLVEALALAIEADLASR
ncbi:N-acetylmuramoyl-L-alanine amidase family protein [Sphingomicrobium nitratireducens]|uniref:N-acetylmuramoyl-L-alanine amidase family protein n=1 Tax=Sphingomicrobium nitratireducens TaxID=2964666 RepID=UPI0022407D15|nr:N-acetylmuramoyl-L-alanine amidase [Sphingomicrobium nitratireducens]